MNIELANLGRRFNYEWVFRRLTITLEASKKYAIVGNNGSGKSTLLHILSGALAPSEGHIVWNLPKPTAPDVDFYQKIAWCSPAMELIDQYTLVEFLQLHASLKPLLPPFNVADLIEIIGLKAAKNKPISQFSSGMKQRVKLAQALFSHTPILLLDEPTANLDVYGIAWYKEHLALVAPNRCVVIASNQQHEYDTCDAVLAITDYKNKK